MLLHTLLQRTSATICLLLGLGGGALGCDAAGPEDPNANEGRNETVVHVPNPIPVTSGGDGETAPTHADAASEAADTMDMFVEDSGSEGTSGGSTDASEEGDSTSGEPGSSSSAVDGDGSDESTAGSESSTGADRCAGSYTYYLLAPYPTTVSGHRSYRRVTTAFDDGLGLINCMLAVPFAEIIVRYKSDATQMVRQPEPGENVEPLFLVSNGELLTSVDVIREVGHIIAIGGANFAAMVEDGVFTGPAATALVRELSGDPELVVGSDGWNVWPYGLDPALEDPTEEELVTYLRLVAAIYEDVYGENILVTL